MWRPMHATVASSTCLTAPGLRRCRVSVRRCHSGEAVGNGMATVTLRQRLRYWFDNTMSKGTIALVAWLAVASLAIVLAGGTLLYLLDPTPEGEDESRGLFDSIWQSVLHALDP